MARIHERIRQALESDPALTQKGLARLMGVNPAAVNRMLHGQRKVMAEEIPLIESYIGQSLGLGEAGDAPQPAPAAAPVPAYRLDSPPPFREPEAADWIPRHPAQSGGKGAYAVFVAGEAFAPRYRAGEIAYVHPMLPLVPGRDALVFPRAGGPFLSCVISETADTLRLSPPGGGSAKTFRKDALAAAHAVVGRG